MVRSGWVQEERKRKGQRKARQHDASRGAVCWIGCFDTDASSVVDKMEERTGGLRSETISRWKEKGRGQANRAERGQVGEDYAWLSDQARAIVCRVQAEKYGLAAVDRMGARSGWGTSRGRRLRDTRRERVRSRWNEGEARQGK